MFKKLLANLPFNPGLIDQVSFYADRLRRESAVRRAGFTLLLAAIGVQVIAGLYPSSNSFIAGPGTASATGYHPPKPAKLEMSKSVENVTRGIWDANGSTAKAGDILQFKLVTKNTGGTAYSNYQGEDDFRHVLQYAEIVDAGELKNQGFTLDENGKLSWNTWKINPGSSETKTIRVRVKSPIPATNSPAPGSADYNCQISNFYGSQVTVNVDCPVVKTVVETATRLPETGSASSIAIAGGVATIAGYFYARSRVMAKELAIVRRDYISAGDRS